MKYNVGDKVYIIPSNGPRDYKNIYRAIETILDKRQYPKTGIITQIYESENIATHGSPLYETIYQVRCISDGLLYVTHSSSSGRIDILSSKELTNRIRQRVIDNRAKIKKLEAENKYIESVILAGK